MNFSNGLPLRSATFREHVRLPGCSQSALYIPSDDYPLTYFPELSLVRATLRKGAQGIQGHGTEVFYHVSVVKDMIPKEDAMAAAQSSGILAVATSGTIKQNPVTGVFERVTEDDALVPEAPPTPAESPAPKRRGRPPKVAEGGQP